MLQVVELKADKRNTGKQISKKIRKEGKIPGIFYAKGDDNISIAVSPLELRPIVYTKEVKLVNLDVEGTQKKCLLKDVKFHPVTDSIIHFDLLGVNEGQKITVEVPIEFIGQPVGVRKGGLFQQGFHKCKITCMPEYLISTIQVDISNLDVGQRIQLHDLSLEGIEFAVPMDSLVCAVNIPRGKAGESLRESVAAEKKK
ncbi:MAG: 50S ribosomal protein L25 [Bacteroidetes bacterium]|nr:50S ribosomal protein L25 [Bacteroidota bacterium]